MDPPVVCMKQKEEVVLQRTLPKVKTIDIEFQNVTYTVQQNSDSVRRILKGVSGAFISGELTAVLGPSGAGKTSLMNILAGYTCRGVSGDGIRVNGRPRNTRHFRPLTTYIMQEDRVQPRLNVMEAMMVASRLKIGQMLHKDRREHIHDILSTLGIMECEETRTERLSGGQRKRLSIALELVSNPSVLFLDEPTTGLDIHSNKQVMGALRILVNQGRTVVCTIHQPSSLEFRAYDNVYVVASGSCVYSGPPSELVPFLDGVGTPCPQTYSPADYIIELVHSCPHTVDLLANAANSVGFIRNISRKYDSKSEKAIKQQTPPSPFWQLWILLGRMLLQRWRNKAFLISQLIHHIVSSVLLGAIFYGIGNDAAYFLPNFKLALSIGVFYVYTYVMVPILNFPYDLKLLKREHFNNWYGLLPYYLAYSFSTIPALVVNVCIFSLIVYTMTGQPMELDRFIYFALLGLLAGLCSEGLGFVIGAIGRVKNGSVMGPAIVAPLFALSIYGMGYGYAIEPFMAVMMQFTFVREPALFMRDVGVHNSSISIALAGMVGFILIHRVMGYAAVKYRLHTDLPSRYAVLSLANKLLSHVRRK
ncbi:uncharacterized protein CBL_10672 [Carabus blaptoides fortunei]